MKRNDFIKTCTVGCLGISGVGLLLQGCAGSKIISANLEGNSLLVPLSEFEIVKKDAVTFHHYIIARNPKLQYPICIYRHSENEYSALLMRCTHQGTELQAFGDQLQCPAHGSEFSNRGNVTNGPAETNLRTFPVNLESNQLRISLL